MSHEKKHFSAEEAKEIGEKLGVKWDKFSVEEFRKGMDIELEHGTIDSNTNVTNDDPLLTGKITLAHLNELRDYNTRLLEMEKEGEKFWEGKE
jgi:hypothetical protein